jgi:MYXO-CTERM domain-containing protein
VGISDYLSATITDDSGLGRGFFVDSPEGPLREMNPPNKEWRWPDDLTGEVHNDGLIIAGTLWDLRELLREKLGDADGIAHSDRIWFESIRRATDMPTMYPEALLVDDDDGDLTNGTPNECEINKAFYAHGLLTAANAGTSVTLGAATPEGHPVALTVGGAPKACVDLKPVAATLRWRKPGTEEIEETSMAADADGFTALLPKQPDNTVIEYQVVSSLSDDTALDFPINNADPWYQLYTGPVTELYCTGFEGADGVEGWEFGNKWAQGAPQGVGGDPAAAFAGTDIVGINLGGTYSPSSSSKLIGPVIDTQGFPVVRLQYRRWLGVEDAHFDQATIRVNDLPAWRNFDSKQGDNSNVQHQDREWRFHDIDITPGVIDGVVQLGFELRTDQGLELAGWNIDEVCVVGVDPTATSLCGNGTVDGDEECDDGNLADDDGCSALCSSEGSTESGETPTTGDDPTGSPDTGGDDDSESGGGPGLDDDVGCGCRSSSGTSGLALGVLVLAGLRRRRRL